MIEGPIYVCGPMTGLPQKNYPAFNEAARKLREQGYVVENPAEMPDIPDGTWADYMRAALTQMMRSRSIAYLPGWERSEGAQLESLIAERLKMPRLYL